MKLTKAQEEASMHFEGPALVLAVPGAGKTTVLLKRIENLINIYKVKPHNILSITFSKSQAVDMEARYNSLYEDDPKDTSPHFSTIHAFAYSILRAYNKEHNKNLNLIEGNNDYNKYALIRRLYYQLNRSFIADDTLEEFFTAVTFIKNSMIDEKSFLKNHKPQIKNFEALFKLYESTKEENNMIDFDDMLTSAYEILLSDKRLLRRIRNRYKFIQVDEAQDTSRIQLEMIKLLASPDNNLFMVADDDQSIYGFRGSVPDELLAFKNTFPEGRLFFMEENHRSFKDIVSVSNRFIQDNVNRYKKVITTNKEKHKPIKLVTCKDLATEHKYLIKSIKEEQESEPDSSIAVLFRNNISSLTLIDTFTKAGIRFNIRDKRNFLDHYVIDDMLNILKFALDTTDTSLYEQIYYKLNAYLRKDYLGHLNYMDSSMTVFDSLLEIPHLKDYQIDRILQLKHAFARIPELNLPRAIEYVETTIGYSVYLKEKIKKSGSAGFAPDLVLEALKMLASGLENAYDLENKLQEIKDLRTFNIPGSVNLSTIHSSKGLEYDSVYIVDLVEGEFPSDKSIDIDPRGIDLSLEEERRLFYVAMTRAKKNLTILSLKERNREPVSPSSFFNKLKRMK